MRSHSYMTRALKSRDPRFARLLGKLGYRDPTPAVDPLDVLRIEAEAAGGKVDRRWGEARLREEIATARRPKRKAPESDDDGGFYKRRDMRAED
jgi:hypothetical protein